MEASEAMVEAAEVAVYGRHERGFINRPLIDAIDMRAALNAALAVAPKPKVRIKPLTWEPMAAWMECSKERALAFGGEYQIVMLDPYDDPPLPSLYFEIGLGAFMFRFEQAQDPLGFPGETCPKKFPSVEAAKAAAQADYERRILAALEDQS